MATIINMSNGSIIQVLASLTNVPTSITAISGTDSWKKYDAIYFECLMHYTKSSDKSIFTNLILTNNVSIGDQYLPIRVTGTDSPSYLNVYAYFSENVLSIYKYVSSYDVMKLNIYGVNF